MICKLINLFKTYTHKKFLVLLNLHFSELRCYLLVTKIQKNLFGKYITKLF